MVKEFTKTMLEKCETMNFSLTFSEVFENLHSNDANFEMASSNTIQPLKIFYRYKIVTDKIAVVFVSGSELETFDDRSRYRKQFPGFAKTAEDLLKEDLEFNDVTVWTDLSKSSMIEKLDLIQCLADDFEYEKNREVATESAADNQYRQNRLLVVAIFNIGFIIPWTTRLLDRHELDYRDQVPTPKKSRDRSKNAQQYFLTYKETRREYLGDECDEYGDDYDG